MPGSPTALRWQVARWISIVCHPFILCLVLVAVGTAQSLPPGKVAEVMGVLFLCGMLPVIVLIRRRMRAGIYTNADVSVRAERSRLYPAALGFLIVALLALSFVQPPRDVYEGGIAVLVLLGIAGLVNLKHKISLHTAFAVFVALAFLPMSPWLAGVGAAVAVAVVWSRLELQRHTPAEVATGALLGLAVGAVLVLW